MENLLVTPFKLHPRGNTNAAIPFIALHKCCVRSYSFSGTCSENTDIVHKRTTPYLNNSLLLLPHTEEKIYILTSFLLLLRYHFSPKILLPPSSTTSFLIGKLLQELSGPSLFQLTSLLHYS